MHGFSAEVGLGEFRILDIIQMIYTKYVETKFDVPVVVVGEVLDTLEVERLDDAIGAEVILRAALRGLDRRPLHARAVHLQSPI